MTFAEGSDGNESKHKNHFLTSVSVSVSQFQLLFDKLPELHALHMLWQCIRTFLLQAHLKAAIA